jgi:hypothetical protein
MPIRTHTHTLSMAAPQRYIKEDITTHTHTLTRAGCPLSGIRGASIHTHTYTHTSLTWLPLSGI